MRFFVLAIGLSIASGPLMAGCNESLLLLDTWKIEAIDSDTNRLTTDFTFTGDRPIRMLDASAGFRDILGERINSFALERDVSLTEGATHQEVGRWGPYTFERLLDMNPDDVKPWVCVWAVVYQDGTVEKF